METTLDEIYKFEKNIKDIKFKVKDGKFVEINIGNIDVSDYTIKEFLEENLSINKILEE